MPTTAITNQFKSDLLGAYFVDFANTVNMLLIKPGFSGVYDETLSNVGTPGTGTPSPTNVGTDEASGTGYTTGGTFITGYVYNLYGNTATFTFDDVAFPLVTLSTVAGVLYDTGSGDVIAVYDFGGTQSPVATDLVIIPPTPGATTSVIRIG